VVTCSAEEHQLHAAAAATIGVAISGAIAQGLICPPAGENSLGCNMLAGRTNNSP